MKDFESNGVYLSDNVYFHQYTELQEIRTHQNRGFLKQWTGKGADPREFYDIITPMIETGVVNTDIDTEQLEPYTDNSEHYLPELITRSVLKQFHRQTNHGVKVNECVEDFIDDGNIVARKVENDGEIYDTVNLLNLYVIDQTAKTLEDTTVIEKAAFNQTKLRGMKTWKNIDQVIKYCDMAGKNELPSYEPVYRYGEVTLNELNYTKHQLFGTEYQENEEDKDKYVQALFIMVRKKPAKHEVKSTEAKAVPVFIEELKPEVIKISKHLTITKYKPYVEAHLGKYKGAWLRDGYRSIGKPFQNGANRIGNKLNLLIPHLKLYYWTDDEKLAGKNILSGFKDGQAIVAKNFKVLNNSFPNLTILVEEWNRNIKLAERALKAFEVATGENIPSSASATAVATQNQAVGKYYNFKQEKLGLFFAEGYKRWVFKSLLKGFTPEEQIQISGDHTLIDEYIGYKAKKAVNGLLIKAAIKGNVISREMYQQLIDVAKSSLYGAEKLFESAKELLMEDVEMYVGLNPTGEAFNKQNKITNSLKVMEYEINPAIKTDPEARETLTEIKKLLGLRVKPRPIQPINHNIPEPVKSGNLPQGEQGENPFQQI